MINKFYNSIFDDKLFLTGNSEEITFGQFKQLVLNNIHNVKDKKSNVVILNNDILSFFINFFSSIFTNKTIYLSDEVIKLDNIDLEYDVLDKADINYDTNDSEFPQINEEEIFINFLTSGSSGYPKIIKKTLKNLIVEALTIQKDLTFEEKIYTVKTTTTFTHLYCMTFALMFPLTKGYIISLDKLYYPDREKFNDVIIVSTPSFLDSIKNNHIKFPSAPKYIISAGSKLSKETFKYLEQDQKVIEIYGSTETGIIGYRTNSDEAELTLFSDVKISPYEDGSIVNTPFSYGNEIKVHDLIEVQGNKIILKTRTDRLLKIQDKRISAESVENQLKENELVNDAFCFKKEDKIACLCALSDKGKDFLLEKGIVELTKKLKQHSKKQFEIIPQKWKYIDAIPTTKRGKIDGEFIAHIFDINFSFPIILERKWFEDRIKYKLYFYPNSNFYGGHFPSHPITPGVAQLYLASFLGNHYFNKQLTDGQIKKVKFSNIIQAGDLVELELFKTATSVKYEYKKDDEIFSSGYFSCENILLGDD